MTAETRTVCRFCRQPITRIPGGWIDGEGWDSCADSGNVHEPAEPPAPNDELLNRYLTRENRNA